MKKIISKSRKATVKILSFNNQISGTGFFITAKHIATNLHVVSIDKGNGQLTISTDTKVIVQNGDIFEATLVSIPSSSDKAPYEHDFAILELKKLPKNAPEPLVVSSGKLDDEVIGDEIIFSGYPLHAPTMLSHKGMISGVVDGKICIQSSVNRGNSGGAVINSAGEVIGIVTLREGDISYELDLINEQIKQNSSPKGIQRASGLSVKSTFTLNGINPLDAIGHLTETLRNYISPGIGYAQEISFLKAYIKSHPDLKIDLIK